MNFISSDANVWIDFNSINRLELPFNLPYTYLMNVDAINEEILYPRNLKSRLLSLGLVPIEISIEEFTLAENYGLYYPKLSKHDRIALAIAKNKNIKLFTGDKDLRNAAKNEKVEVIGTLWILDQLFEENYIDLLKYKNCLKELKKHNGKLVRLPKHEIKQRLERLKVKTS